MTHKYNIAGMTCEGCAGKIKATIEQVPDIESAEVNLKGGYMTIKMNKHFTIEELQKILDPLKKYTISETSSDNNNAYDEEKKNWFSTYKPLILIFLYIIGISIYVSINDGNFDYHIFMNIFMVGFFITFSFFKLLDLKGFAESYSTYDILAKKIPAYGYVYPFIELTLGIAYLLNYKPEYTNIATIIVMGFSSIGVIQSVLDRKKIRCACLGSVFNLPMSTITIIEDLLMVLMAAISLI